VLSDDIKKTANYLRDYKIEKLLFWSFRFFFILDFDS
jgi:hypothetical protein